MSRVAIAIDDWKLAIFKEELTADGFKYKQTNGLTPSMLILTVETDDLARLAETVKRASLKSNKRGPIKGGQYFRH